MQTVGAYVWVNNLPPAPYRLPSSGGGLWWRGGSSRLLRSGRCSQKAKFCLSEVKIGLSPAVISPYVQRALGERQMRRYALTAEVMDAPTAMALGLVHQVVEHDALDSAVDAMLDTLLGGSPPSPTGNQSTDGNGCSSAWHVRRPENIPAR